MSGEIPLFKVAMASEAAEQVTQVLKSGFIGQGPKVDEFEKALEPWIGGPSVTTNSATAALTMAMKLSGVGPGAHVISTPLTCSATNIPILHLGATPLWADIDPQTGLIDPASVEQLVLKYRETVKAIIAVDWGGTPCDYDALHQVSDGVPIVEDAAHAFGAWYRERRIGTVADYTALSFQAIKHLTTGDGGALRVPESQWKRARDMRWFGIDRDDPTVQFRGETDITEPGFKFHMNDIAATIGLANLPQIDMILRRHRSAALVYTGELDSRFSRTMPRYDHESSWWMYTVLLPSQQERDDFRSWMGANGITVSQVHWRNDKLSIFEPFMRELPGVDEFTSRMICLPTHWQTRAWKVLSAANEFFDQ